MSKFKSAHDYRKVVRISTALVRLNSGIIYDTQINYAEIVSVFAVSSKHVICFFSKSVPSTSEE